MIENAHLKTHEPFVSCETYVRDATDGGSAEDDDRGAVVVVDERPTSLIFRTLFRGSSVQAMFERAAILRKAQSNNYVHINAMSQLSKQR